MEKYECTVCRWLYDPETGDEETGVPRGTTFYDLPDDWVCPQCEASKDEFERV